MKYKIRDAEKQDLPGMLAVFNWYAENSMACYAEEALPLQFMETFQERCKGYPSLVVENSEGDVVGFANLHPHHQASSFKNTAEITCFLLDEYTGQGAGAQMYSLLLEAAREKGITCIMANISSINTGSINFHNRQGFQHCGRFRSIGNKRGQEFDVVWMQRLI